MATFPRELWAMFVECPADELGPCYFYEYSRESKSLREVCAKSRPAVPPDAANGFDYYLSSPWSKAHGELITDPARVFMLWPEWPDKPYLQIPAEERRRASDQPSPEGSVAPAGLNGRSPSGLIWVIAKKESFFK